MQELAHSRREGGNGLWTMDVSCITHTLLQIDVATGDKYYQAGVWKDGKMQVGDWQR